MCLGAQKAKASGSNLQPPATTTGSSKKWSALQKPRHTPFLWDVVRECLVAMFDVWSLDVASNETKTRSDSSRGSKPLSIEAESDSFRIVFELVCLQFDFISAGNVQSMTWPGLKRRSPKHADTQVNFGHLTRIASGSFTVYTAVDRSWKLRESNLVFRGPRVQSTARFEIHIRHFKNCKGMQRPPVKNVHLNIWRLHQQAIVPSRLGQTSPPSGLFQHPCPGWAYLQREPFLALPHSKLSTDYFNNILHCNGSCHRKFRCTFPCEKALTVWRMRQSASHDLKNQTAKTTLLMFALLNMVFSSQKQAGLCCKRSWDMTSTWEKTTFFQPRVNTSITTILKV